jgi:hypothetical protein
LEADRVATTVTEGDDVLIESAALVAVDVAGVEGVGFDDRTAGAAGGPEIMKAFQVAALALPVADGIVDKIELGQTAEVRDGKYTGEDGLKAGVIAFGREEVHLQEPLIALFLDFDEIRDGNRGLDLGKVHALALGNVRRATHISLLKGMRKKNKR